MYMLKKQRWSWSDTDSNNPVERSPLSADPKKKEQTIETNKQNVVSDNPTQQPDENVKSVDYLDTFFDDKHMRESTYERMSKREPMVQTGTNPYLQNSYIDGITIRDKYLMPYHESKPRTKKNEIEP